MGDRIENIKAKAGEAKENGKQVAKQAIDQAAQKAAYNASGVTGGLSVAAYYGIKYWKITVPALIISNLAIPLLIVFVLIHFTSFSTDLTTAILSQKCPEMAGFAGGNTEVKGDLAALYNKLAKTDPGNLPAYRVNGEWFSSENVHNAAIILSVAIQLNMPQRAYVVALSAAMQESALKNNSGGDRDSAGLFQMRPSANWGSYEQVTDPWYAALKFFKVLSSKNGWQNMSIGQAAQAVEVSAFPDKYAKHEPWATKLAQHLTDGVSSSGSQTPGSGGPSDGSISGNTSDPNEGTTQGGGKNNTSDPNEGTTQNGDHNNSSNEGTTQNGGHSDSGDSATFSDPMAQIIENSKKSDSGGSIGGADGKSGDGSMVNPMMGDGSCVSGVVAGGPLQQNIANIAMSQQGIAATAGKCQKYSPLCTNWCALFAHWVWKQAGIPDELNPIVPSVPHIPDSVRAGNGKKGTLKVGANANPQVGDAVMFTHGGEAGLYHIGIVVQVDSKGIKTVEGNSGTSTYGAVVYHYPNSYRDTSDVYGYVSPPNVDPTGSDPKPEVVSV